MTLTIELPEKVSADKRERLAVALFDAQALSQGEAAEIAGLSQAEFIMVLGHHGVTPFQYDADDILADAERLAASSSGQTTERKSKPTVAVIGTLSTLPGAAVTGGSVVGRIAMQDYMIQGQSAESESVDNDTDIPDFLRRRSRMSIGSLNPVDVESKESM